MKTIICIPVYDTTEPLLVDCIKNVRDTTGADPVVWESKENVSIARSDAINSIDADHIIFLDSDAFPQEKNWHLRMSEVAELTHAGIVSPREVLFFSDSEQVEMPQRSNKQQIIEMIGTPNVAGMCLLVQKNIGTWDRSFGLSKGFLGPCIEDTDFAFSIYNEGRKHVKVLDVSVLHKDRGFKTMAEWEVSDEFLCYEIMSELLSFKWSIKDKVERSQFFSGIGKVPCGKNSRMLADGYDLNKLMECFEPVLSKITSLNEFARSMMQHMVLDMIEKRKKLGHL